MRPEGALLLLLLAGAASAQEIDGRGLDGRTVLMRSETWDDPEKPFLRSSDYVGVVGKGPEFGFAVETMGNLFVVPVTIDLGPDRVAFSYEASAGGTFVDARFNGYVLTFPVECTLLEGASIDEAATTLPVTDAHVAVGPQELRLDLAGLRYRPSDRVVLRLDVADCPIS